MNNAVTQFVNDIRQGLPADFIKLSLGHYTGSEPDLKKISVKKVILKRAEKLSFVYSYKTRDITKNYEIEQGLSLITDLLRDGFQTATLFTASFDLVLDKGKIRKAKPSHTDIPSEKHDREKHRLIGTDNKPYLHALGITDANGAVYKNAQDKYRQINKFVEIMDGLIKSFPALTAPRIADMGSGKGYLTFALYDHWCNALNLTPHITGVEYRDDLVSLCNDIAKQSDFKSLSFIKGAIDDYDATGTNILIALHACDTATDDAIAKGIKAGSELIVVAPCCHKQIRREMEHAKQSNDLDFLSKHGIFLEREAEMITDGLRGLILEYFGYTVKIFEFISDSHTPKNVLIVATKNKNRAENSKILEKIKQAKAYFGIAHHHLETAMGL